jgi:putative phosphoesterase
VRIIVVSDLHANLAAVEQVLTDMPSHDEFYCLGDVVGYGPQPNEVVEALKAQNPTVLLGGNHDHAVVTGDTSGFVEHAVKAIQWTRQNMSQQNLSFLEALRPSAGRSIGKQSIALYHGSARDPLNEYVFPGTSPKVLRELIRLSKARLVLHGHTHVPMAFRDGLSVLLNPGSVGQPRDGDSRASYMILEIDGENCSHKIRRVQYDVEKTSREILANGLPRFLGERLHQGI